MMGQETTARECSHKHGRILWNEFNGAFQCHVCGRVFAPVDEAAVVPIEHLQVIREELETKAEDCKLQAIKIEAQRDALIEVVRIALGREPKYE